PDATATHAPRVRRRDPGSRIDRSPVGRDRSLVQAASLAETGRASERGPQGSSGEGTPPSPEGLGQRSEFLHVERLGPKLTAEALCLEPGVDVGLGPALAPEPGQDVTQVLAAVEEEPRPPPVRPS